MRYISGLTLELMNTLNKYTEIYEANSIKEDIIEEGEKLSKQLTDKNRKK